MKDEMAFDESCSWIRKEIEIFAGTVKLMLRHRRFESMPTIENSGEVKANIMLAYRHLQDAAVRMDKAMQAFNDRQAF